MADTMSNAVLLDTLRIVDNLVVLVNKPVETVVVALEIEVSSMVWDLSATGSAEVLIVVVNKKTGFTPPDDVVEKVVAGSKVVVPEVIASVVVSIFIVVEVVVSLVGIIHALSLHDLSSDGRPKHGFAFGPFAAIAKNRLRFWVPNPHVLLHLLHGPKSDHIQSTVHFSCI